MHEDALAALVEAEAIEELFEYREQEALVRYQLVTRWLRLLGVWPGRLEQAQALEEIYLGQSTFPLEELVSEAGHCHSRYRRKGFSRAQVDPRLLAGSLHYAVEPDCSISEARSGRWNGIGYIQHAVLENDADVGFQILHEIAELRIGRRGSHPDVQVLTALLALERHDVRPLLKHGAASATRQILKQFSHVPAWLLAVSVLLRAEK